MDRRLDAARSGPLFLLQAAIAKLVVESLCRGVDLGHYRLGAFAVMGNHVHALLLPLIPPSRLLKSLKGFTAHEANRLLGRTGQAFWQRESYDHWVRDAAEWNRIAAYIEANPVRSGLVGRPEDYRWSSACEAWRGRLTCPSVDTSVDAARTSAHATVGGRSVDCNPIPESATI
jgi:REP element-mobilizing transposase RayT